MILKNTFCPSCWPEFEHDRHDLISFHQILLGRKEPHHHQEAGNPFLVMPLSGVEAIMAGNVYSLKYALQYYFKCSQVSKK